MAYNRTNLLTTVKKIQDITIREQENGLRLNEIYYKFIEERFFISYRTFSKYLGINVGLEMEKEKNKNSVKD